MRTTASERTPAQRARLVIAASSVGTIFEWYDFYLYGLLATILSVQFFSGVNETTGFILALPPSQRGSRYARSGPWYSAASAIWSAERTPSS